MLGITSNIVGGFNRDDNIIAKINKINKLKRKKREEVKEEINNL